MRPGIPHPPNGSFGVPALAGQSDIRLRLRVTVVTAMVVGLVSALSGCSRPIPRDAVIVAQSPRTIKPDIARDELDLRYPTGSRIVIAEPAPRPQSLRVLSAGFDA